MRDVEHADEYPEAWIEQMKRIGSTAWRSRRPTAVHRCRCRATCEVTQELSRGWMSLAGAMGGHTVVAKLLVLFGTEEQKRRYLPSMATGELRATMALTEPGGGSDLRTCRRLRCRPMVADLAINGSKTWISNARRSGLIALLCKTDPTATPGTRASRWCSSSRARGCRCRGDLPKLGYKGVESVRARLSRTAVCPRRPSSAANRAMASRR